VISGYLVLAKVLAFGPTLVAAAFGSIVGISLSYALGRGSGSYVSKFGFAANRLPKAEQWFARFGGWTFIVGYFIPGIRNLIGFASGMMRLRLGYFVPYAYAGAILSSAVGVFAGYFLGEQAAWVLGSVSRAALVVAAAASLFLIRRAMRNGAPEAVKITATATAMSGNLE
jgi:membrane protein DedA with SNARE-associated domain